MKATAIFCENYKEMDRAEELAIPLPEFIPKHEDFYFDLRTVSAAYKNEEGDINALIQGSTYTFKYEESVWNKLINKLENGIIS